MSAIFQNYARYPLTFVKGEGARLTDENGRVFLDFGCGISVVNLGHSHPHVTKAIQEQAATLIHTSNLYRNPLQEQLADRLSRCGFGGDVFFCNSGAEANEAALKLARIYTNKKYDGKRSRVLTLQNSFHGRTYMTLSATGQEKVKKGFEPIMECFTHIRGGDFGSFLNEVKKGDVGAVILEIVQGEGGLEMLPRDYLVEVSEYCAKYDILLILDEIQTGFGRTGDIFAYKHYGITPDIMTLAKGIANGVPMGAVMAKHEVAEYLSAGTHGSTFGGNYLACAAAHAVLDVMTEKGFMLQVREKGDWFLGKLAEIFHQTEVTVHGTALMSGVKVPGRQKEFIENCMKNGLIVIPAGNDVVRIYPPLTVTYEELEEGLALIRKSASEMGIGD
ncbi:aspartate aminotransferase family protein [Seleniivibrio woodruffii]|uniref:aspartate aminotransferase family protein n=1 Tax=Seleniivibrio woodruffii TaxID=1078050 RepID=UPI002409F0CB|nr:acetylornithine transaminase [Seleniivibrio woodruffii]